MEDDVDAIDRMPYTYYADLWKMLLRPMSLPDMDQTEANYADMCRTVYDHVSELKRIHLARITDEDHQY